MQSYENFLSQLLSTVNVNPIVFVKYADNVLTVPCNALEIVFFECELNDSLKEIDFHGMTSNQVLFQA